MKLFIQSQLKHISPRLSKIITNFGWLSIAKTVQLGVNIFISIWLARYLGPNQFGIFNYSLAFVTLFSSFAALGLHGLVIRDIVYYPDKTDIILGTTFGLKFIGSLIAVVIIYFSIQWNNNNTILFFIVMIIAIKTIFLAFGTIDLWFQAKVESKYVVYVRSFTLMVGAGIKLSCILFKSTLITFAWIVVIEAILQAIGFVWVYHFTGGKITNWRFSVSMAKNLLGQSWVLILSSIGVIIYLKIDQVMLGNMVDQTEVGIYSAAVKLSETWYFIPSFIAASVFPAMIKSKTQGIDIYHSRLQHLYNLMSWLGIGIAIPITFFSEQIVLLLYGDAYQGTGVILSIHIWAGVFAFFGQVLSKWIINENLLIFSPIRHTLGAVVNISLNLFLIPIYGGLGAAIATVISYATGSYLACFFYRPTRIAGKMMTRAIISPIYLIPQCYKWIMNKQIISLD